jgi:polyferredoxin
MDRGFFRRVEYLSNECMNCISGIEGNVIKANSEFWLNKNKGIIRDIEKVSELSDEKFSEVLTSEWMSYTTVVEKVRTLTKVPLLKHAESLVDQILSRNNLLIERLKKRTKFDFFECEQTKIGKKNLLFRKI